MTFEEKLAERGRKMDEMKANLVNTINARKQERQETREEITAEIAKLDAAFEAFDAALETQLDKQMDAFDARVEKRIDDMDTSLDQAEEKAAQDIAKVKAAFTLDKEAAEAIANEATAIDEIQKGTAEQVARAKGDITTAEENARLARENHERKCDALQLRTQMTVNGVTAKIAARKEAKDNAEQEAFILDLLDYANGCYDMVNSWLYEAEFTLMEAAYEIDYYNERFGKEE